MKKMKKFEDGGLANLQGYVKEGNRSTRVTDDPDQYNQRKNRLSQIEDISRKEGRKIGNERQEDAQLRSAPGAYARRGVDFIKDKMSDADAYLSEKMGLDRRAADKRGLRKGLKDEGYKAGGMVSSASKRADGCATKGKTRGKMVTMKSGGKC
jgi:hypothetical protein